MKTPITYYGGKQNLLPEILPAIPDHRTYTESFFGGGAVFFAKKPAKVEVINDINAEIINFYRVLKTDFDALVEKIALVIHSRRTHQDAYVIYTNPHLFDEVTRAWALWVLSKQGFSGQLSNSWGYDIQGKSTGVKIQNAKEQLTLQYQKRLEATTIECGDGLKVIKTFDTPHTFHYVYTPYFNSDCAHYGGYTQTMFEDCLKVLEKAQGKFLLSNYPSAILDEYIQKNGWVYRDMEMKVAVSGKTKKMKTERLVANYDFNNMSGQMALF